MRRWVDLLVPAVLLIAALWLRFEDGALAQRVRLLVFDVYQAIEPREVVLPSPVIIVAIDEESLNRIGQWPWPRTILASLVDRLREAGAITVGLDIILAEPDRSSLGNLWDLYKDLPQADMVRDALTSLPDPDATLAASLLQLPSVGAFALSAEGSHDAPKHLAGFAVQGDDPQQFVFDAPNVIDTIEIYDQSFKGLGFVNFIPDPDLIVRRVPLLMKYEDELYPSFVAELLRVAQGASSYLVKSSGASGEENFGQQTGIAFVRVGDAVIPTDGAGQLLIYDTGHSPERFVSAWKVLDGSLPPETFAGKVVLVGATATALYDMRATPLSAISPGVEIHAQLIEQVVNGQYLYRPDWAKGAELIYMALAGILMIVLIRRTGAIGAAVIGFVVVAAALGVSWLAFASEKWLLDPVTPSAAALVVYMAASLLGYLQTESDRRQIRSAFGQYVSPALVERMMDKPPQLGGETRELTILFCDIRGFTDIAERLDPTSLTALINAFLTPMTRVIQEREGTIDKYIGDAIMAFWNAPLDDPLHVRHGLESALAMRAELARLNENWAADAAKKNAAFSPLQVGIGLNTGRCSVGNFGSEQRFDYSALGDAVNLSARLEALSRLYNIDTIVGQATADAAGDGFALLEIDRVRVKGRQAPEAIFALLGDAAVAQTAAFRAVRSGFSETLEHYRAQRWDAALTALAALRNNSVSMPNLDGLLGLWEYRITQYRQSPPPPDWDGVFAAQTKSG